MTAWSVTVAWMPYILMSVLLMLTGLVRQLEPPGKDHNGRVKTPVLVPMKISLMKSLK